MAVPVAFEAQILNAEAFEHLIVIGEVWLSKLCFSLFALLALPLLILSVRL